MWIFLNDAMLSIVAHRECKETLLVRARLRGDIEAVFPDVEVWEDRSADYRWRAHVPREDVSRALFERVFKIDYPNFKGSVRDSERHDWYLRVWAEGDRVQANERSSEAWRPVVKRATQRRPASQSRTKARP